MASKPAIQARNSGATKAVAGKAITTKAGGPTANVGTPATPVKAPAFQIESHQDRERFLKMLVYGDYGVGKTYLAGTAADVPEMRDVLIINAESGDLTLDSDEHSFDKIDVVTVQNYNQCSRVYEYLKLHSQFRLEGNDEKLRGLQDLLFADNIKDPKRLRKYCTVVVDSLTEVEAYCMNQLLGISDTTKLDDEVQSAEWSEYKKNHSMMQRMVRNFRNLPMHVIMTCARNYIQNEQKQMLFSPQMTGKLSGQIQGFMDMVGFLVLGATTEDGRIPRRLYVQPTGKFAAKCRFSSFKGDHIDNPTIKVILDAVGLSMTKNTSKK
ncbi:hypothetical protein LCGC14_2965920 [marine sediment metagenome]|uniref:Uncharacterized protein n=1 Tax=marine sediment metagenome TaxID=412755 RepID=A0A0F9A246_9ZZZZ